MSEVQARLRRAGWVAGAAYLVQAPYLVYLTRVAYPEALAKRIPALSTEELLRLELLRIAVLVVLAALVGAFLSRRNGLPDLGDRHQLRRAAPWIAGAALGSVLSHAAVGSDVAAALPGQYPCEVRWALVTQLKGAVFDEVIARYGMMTIVMGVVRRVALANVLQATFFAGVAARALFFDAGGGGPGLDALTIASVGTSWLVNLACGHVYARHGLYAAIGVHLAVGLRFPVHALTAAVCGGG